MDIWTISGLLFTFCITIFLFLYGLNKYNSKEGYLIGPTYKVPGAVIYYQRNPKEYVFWATIYIIIGAIGFIYGLFTSFNAFF